MTKTDYGSQHQEILREASKVYRKNQMTIGRRVLRAVPYGVEMAFIAVLVPVAAARLTGLNVIWPALAVALATVLVKIVRDDLVLKARDWWATKTEQLSRDLAEIGKRHQELEAAYKEGEAKLVRISAALRTLEGVLKSDVISLCQGDVAKSVDGVSTTTTATPEIIRNDLRLLCQSICDILGGSDNMPMRCGVLIRDPRGQQSLVPIVVYDRDDPTYVSRTRYDSDDFAGQLLRRFEERQHLPDWKKYTAHVISDIDAIRDTPPWSLDRKPIVRRTGQDEYLKSIGGSVIYCRDHDKQIRVLGVVNVDSRVPGAIDEDAYRLLQPYLFPAFRLFASRLLLIQNDIDLIGKIWGAETQDVV